MIESYARPGSGLERFEAQGMGTVNVLLLGGAPGEALEDAARDAFDLLRGLERRLSKFLPSSDVSRLNARGAFEPVAVGEDLLVLLRLSRRAWELTDGAFDPTVGPLLDAWGFTGAARPAPSDVELAEMRARSGMDRIVVDEDAGTARLDREGVVLDLGAIAKGYAVDRVAERLRALGIPAGAVISGRSSIVFWGAPPGDDRWRVEVDDPGDADEILRALRVEPGAVSSSGSSERRLVRDGREYGHVMDPRSGRPARGVIGVTAWTPTALLGDVLSTAVLVRGGEALEEGGVAERLIRGWGPEPHRASVLLLEENPRVWGGMDVRVWHSGRPGFEKEPRPSRKG
jgi:thiamine biosynthesis lipoprotein